MFHHLELPEKEKTLRDTRRVLVGGGSLHLLDFGGADAGSQTALSRACSTEPRACGTTWKTGFSHSLLPSPRTACWKVGSPPGLCPATSK